MGLLLWVVLVIIVVVRGVLLVLLLVLLVVMDELTATGNHDNDVATLLLQLTRMAVGVFDCGVACCCCCCCSSVVVWWSSLVVLPLVLTMGSFASGMTVTSMSCATSARIDDDDDDGVGNDDSAGDLPLGLSGLALLPFFGSVANAGANCVGFATGPALAVCDNVATAAAAADGFVWASCVAHAPHKIAMIVLFSADDGDTVVEAPLPPSL